jgi:hypothetical protein
MNDKPVTIEAAVRADLAAQQPAAAPKGVDESAISEKTAAGLTRTQAVEVIARQAAEDAARAKEAKAAKKPKAE